MANASTPSITVSADFTISGPSNYMSDRFPIWKQEFEARGSAVVDYGMKFKGLSLQQALQIAIQTDYSGWLGTKQLLNYGR